MKMLVVLSVCVCALGACSSSGPSKSTTTETIGNSVPNSEPATVPALPIGPAACSLVTPAQVKTLLRVAATGVEKDFSPGYKSCSWTATPAGATIANTLVLGAIRIGNGQVGFATTAVGLTATVFPGLGDAATYSTGKNTLGSQQRLLVTKKGTVGVSISVGYGGTSNAPPAIQHDMTVVARAAFTTLHA